MDVNTLARSETNELALNEIGRCQFILNEKVQFDNYQQNRLTGAFIVVDRLTNITVGAGMIDQPLSVEKTQNGTEISEFERDLNWFVRKHFPHWNARDINQ